MAIVLLYKPNYLDSSIAACGATGRAMKTILKLSFRVRPVVAVFLFCFYPLCCIEYCFGVTPLSRLKVLEK